jgi:hypothetical protein
MCEALHLPELKGAVEAATVEDASVLRLALHDDAKLTDEDFVDVLSKRRVFEADNADEREEIDQQVIDDTLSPSDRKEMMEFSQRTKQLVAMKSNDLAYIRAVVGKIKGVPKEKKVKKDILDVQKR